MAVNYSPNFVGYKDVKPFRFWCQKVLPSVYDDSLSYYELLNKVVHYLNVVIDNLEGVEQNTDALLNAYNQLQEYVNAYFDNLDLGEEIERKINEMVEGGTFDEILAPAIAQYEQQLQQILDEYEEQAGDYVEDAEAWAKGTRNGIDVSNSDPAFMNNSKYYSENSRNSAVTASNASATANSFAQESEAWAKGTKQGVDVVNTADQYHNNSKYWCEQARQAAVDATNSEQAEAWATGEIGGTPVGSSDPQYQNSAKYWAEQAEQVVGDATYANEAQAWANGEVNGTPVASTEPQYQNNAKYYAQQAQAAASDTTQSNEAEAWAVGEKGGVAVTSADAQYENNAKYYAQQAAQQAGTAASNAVSAALVPVNAEIAEIKANAWKNLVAVTVTTGKVNKTPINGGTDVPGLFEFTISNSPNTAVYESWGDFQYMNRWKVVHADWDSNNGKLYLPYNASLGSYGGNKVMAVRVWDLTTGNWAVDNTTISQFSVYLSYYCSYSYSNHGGTPINQ